jgi:8-oxo-dGTP pyrophosphatase MutT (NUDIX family)
VSTPDWYQWAQLHLEKNELEQAGPFRASVAIVIHQLPEQNTFGLLFIKRSEHPLDPWSGHVAFPGGLASSPNELCMEVALRELEEEIGLVLRGEHWLGRLPSLGTYLKRADQELRVSPELFFTPMILEPKKLTPCPEEVSSIFAMDFNSLREKGRMTQVDFQHEGEHHRFPGIEHREGIIWGLTYRMVQEVLKRL